MNKKVLVSLAGGLAEDDGNVVLVGQGQSVPALTLSNTYIRNDELCFQQGYSSLNNPIIAVGGTLVLTSESAFLVGTTILAQGAELSLGSQPSALTSHVIFPQGGTLSISSLSASVNKPAIILASSGLVRLSSSSARVGAFVSLQPAFNLSWILTAGE
jgi:hypothetical protein